ncbi:MAG: hypothetical protein EOO65_04810, partial [Methanosarcinales archaeon]
PAVDDTTGGRTVRITGSGFAFGNRLSSFRVRLNALGVAAPADELMSASWSGAAAGDVHMPAVERWVSELASLRTMEPVSLGGDVHQVEAIIPEGWGHHRAMFVVVDGVPSNIVSFTYRAPTIDNVAPDRVGVQPGFLRVFVDGSSFCSGANGCGQVLLDGAPMVATNYSHSQIVFVMEEPVEGIDRTVQVVVDGVGSNVINFRKPVPNFNSLTGQGSWTGMDTAGGELFFIAGVRDVGSVPTANIRVIIGEGNCTGLSKAVDGDNCVELGVDPASPGAEACRTYRLSCTTPPGVGTGLGIFIAIPGGTSRVDPNFVFSYAPPSVSEVLEFSDASKSYRVVNGEGIQVHGMPTVGTRLVIQGRNFGFSNDNVSASVFFGSFGAGTVVSQNHSELVVDTPAYQGKDVRLVVMVAGQTSLESAPGLAAPAPVMLRYSAPVVTSVSPQRGSTQGGYVLTLTGSNFGTMGGVAGIASD